MAYYPLSLHTLESIEEGSHFRNKRSRMLRRHTVTQAGRNLQTTADYGLTCLSVSMESVYHPNTGRMSTTSRDSICVFTYYCLPKAPSSKDCILAIAPIFPFQVNTRAVRTLFPSLFRLHRPLSGDLSRYFARNLARNLAHLPS